jgi:hypothetical protein
MASQPNLQKKATTWGACESSETSNNLACEEKTARGPTQEARATFFKRRPAWCRPAQGMRISSSGFTALPFIEGSRCLCLCLCLRLCLFPSHTLARARAHTHTHALSPSLPPSPSSAGRDRWGGKRVVGGMLARINIGADVWGESSIMTGVYQRWCSSTLHIGLGLYDRVCQVLVL